MPHVDEGTLHTLLDGELAPAALAEVRVHFATCPSCAARLNEARQLLAETERLVSALELPGREAQPRAAAGAGAVAGVLMPPPPGAPLPPLDPVVLIPENPTIREIRRSRTRQLGWAAGFLVVVGAGFLGVTSLRETPRSSDGRLRISPDEFTTAPPRAEREGATDSAPTLGLTDSAAPALNPAAPSVRAEVKRKTAAPPAPQHTAPTPTPRPIPAPAPAVAVAPRTDADAAAAEAADQSQLAKAAADRAPGDTFARNAAAPPADSRPESVNRSGAAQATYELDRRRTRERAAEATAALERELAERRAAEERQRQLAARREAATVTAAPAAAPPRPPVDDRTGISSRIGLDEAARQLGGPLHAIDGMSRQMVGLVAGTSVDGADPSRPVVRAVYVDRSGTTLFLDQQMAQPGDGPATPQTGRGGRQVWVKDGVRLVLHGGGLDADSLRSLARRVR